VGSLDPGGVPLQVLSVEERRAYLDAEVLSNPPQGLERGWNKTHMMLSEGLEVEGGERTDSETAVVVKKL
jgi:hypothetical protein